jgi:hypothetical protein
VEFDSPAHSLSAVFPSEVESPTGISIGVQGSLIRKGRMSFP